MKKIVLLFATLFISCIGFSQEIEISLQHRLSSVDYIFEGKVLESHSYYTDNGKNINTSHLIEITKSFKGVECGTIELITEGGQINGKELTISHALQLRPNTRGLFLCNDTDKELPKNEFYIPDNIQAVSGTFENQSFIKYWIYENQIKAADFNKRYDNLNNLYNEIKLLTGLSMNDCGVPIAIFPNQNGDKNDTPKSSAEYDFNPKTLAGGISDTLTIEGTDFGINKGFALFPNANDGGNSQVFIEEDMIPIWNDSLIKIIIPSNATQIDTTGATGNPAGSGIFEVRDEVGSLLLKDTIKIEFSIINYPEDNKPYVMAPWKEMNGKFIFRYDTSVANYDNGRMKETIEKALNDWKCLTGIDWELGSDTLNKIESATLDTVCTISFRKFPDSSNILAQTRTWGVRSTSISDTSYQIIEIDIEVNSNYNWFSDTLISHPVPTNFIDFYSVILHELGHGHGLRHVIDTNAIMHYSINKNQRLIDISNDTSCDKGGNWMADYTNDTTNLMLNSDFIRMEFDTIKPCSNFLSVVEEKGKEPIITIFPNPANNHINIDNSINNPNDYQVIIYDMNGKILLQTNFQNKIDISKLESGLYLLQITSSKDKFNQTIKIIKQ